MTAIAPISSASMPATTATPPVAAATGTPAPSDIATFDIPQELLAKFTASAAEGMADATTFLQQHGKGEASLLPAWSILRLGWPPKEDAEGLATLHAIEKTRTPDGIAAAKYWAANGLDTVWLTLLKEYTSHVGPAQARAAERLMNDALMLSNEASQISKASVARTRPFVDDPTLTVAINKPGNNPSFPSGHTSSAYAGAEVLAYLMPDRKDEFLSLAAQVAYSRLYGGVHYPTDVIAGVKVATTVTAVLTRSTMAKPKRGTKPKARNGGVAGGRHAILASTATPAPSTATPAPGRIALAGAAHLAGPALAGAAQLAA
jgi:hypothetical protein